MSLFIFVYFFNLLLRQNIIICLMSHIYFLVKMWYTIYIKDGRYDE